MNTNFSPAEIQAYLAPIYAGHTLRVIPYAYAISFASLAQGATAQGLVNVAANADFLLLGVNHHANIGAAQTTGSKTAPFVRMLVTDSGSNEQFTNAAVDLENYSTNGIGIQNLPYPRIVSGRSSLTVQVTNYAPTAETYQLDILFSGALIRVYSSSGVMVDPSTVRAV